MNGAQIKQNKKASYHIKEYNYWAKIYIGKKNEPQTNNY